MSEIELHTGILKKVNTKGLSPEDWCTIETKDKTIMFPIDMNDKDDVGTTTFEAEYKPITLMRYIRKAIEKDELVIVNK